MKLVRLGVACASLLIPFPGHSAAAAQPDPGIDGQAPATPGAHKHLPCKSDAKLTYDLYLPKAYASPVKPGDRGFPALFLSGPHKNPGFQDLSGWADDNGVILVTFNDSENGPTDAIIKVQDAVLQSLAGIRIHPTLRFASGFSGAAAASMVLVERKPREFAGVVMHCHSAYLPKLPKTTAISWLSRYKDEFQNFAGFIGAADEARSDGHFVHEDSVAGSHSWLPKAPFIRALNIELTYAKLTNPGLNDAEKKAYATLPQTILAEAANDPVSDGTMDRLDALAEPADLKNRPFRAAAVQAWALLKVKQIDAMQDSKPAFRMFTDGSVTRIFGEATGKAQDAVRQLTKKLEADPALKNEFAGWRDWLRLRAQYAVTAKRFDSGKYNATMSGFGKLAKDKTKEGTYAAELAQYCLPPGKK